MPQVTCLTSNSLEDSLGHGRQHAEPCAALPASKNPLHTLSHTFHSPSVLQETFRQQVLPGLQSLDNTCLPQRCRCTTSCVCLCKNACLCKNTRKLNHWEGLHEVSMQGPAPLMGNMHARTLTGPRGLSGW